MSNVLVFAEHAHGKFPKSTLVALTAGKDAAAKFGGECYATVMGTKLDTLANELAEYGVKKVFVVDDAALEHYVADAYAAALAQVAKDKGAEVVVATATAIGKDLLPRVAIRLDAGMASDITGINADGEIRKSAQGDQCPCDRLRWGNQERQGRD